MRPFGRIAACGMVSQYNDTKPAPGPRNLMQLVASGSPSAASSSPTIRSATAISSPRSGPLVARGEIVAPVSIVDGIERAPDAFIGMLRGEHRGKVIVRLS
jgi:NADPH-dependent curcumin reductase CurA